jgi:hypothetical protein
MSMEITLYRMYSNSGSRTRGKVNNQVTNDNVKYQTQNSNHSNTVIKSFIHEGQTVHSPTYDDSAKINASNFYFRF